MPIKIYMNVQVASILFAQHVRRRTWEIRFRMFLTLGRAELKSSGMYALEGDRVSSEFCITKNRERKAFAGALQLPTLQFALALGGGDCGLKRLFTFRRLALT
jgi:hypothetical protein